MSQKLIFVSGCARSGTTVMATILNWSDSVFIAQERYAPLIRHRPEEFKPELYEVPRMLKFEPGECGYEGFESKAEYSAFYANPKDFTALERYPYIGDKITHLFRIFNTFAEPEWADKQITLVHVIRDIASVAASYRTRMLDATDNWEWDHVQAMTDWTDAVDNAHRLYTQPLPNVRFGMVDYDSLFNADLEKMVQTVGRVYGFIGIDLGEKQLNGFRKVFLAGERSRGRRQAHPDIREEVDARIADETLFRHQQLLGWCL